jgi:hypothetical protein
LKQAFFISEVKNKSEKLVISKSAHKQAQAHIPAQNSRTKLHYRLVHKVPTQFQHYSSTDSGTKFQHNSSTDSGTNFGTKLQHNSSTDSGTHSGTNSGIHYNTRSGLYSKLKFIEYIKLQN